MWINVEPDVADTMRLALEFKKGYLTYMPNNLEPVESAAMIVDIDAALVALQSPAPAQLEPNISKTED